MANIQALADHSRTTSAATAAHAFLADRRDTWYANDDGTAASLPAVLSRQVCADWIGPDGRLLPDTDPLFGTTPLQIAYAFHALAYSDPLDEHRNTYPSAARTPAVPARSEPGVIERAPAASVRQVGRRPDLYFISGDDGPIKIGISVDPAARLKGLQTGYPHKLRLLAVVPNAGLMEGEYHRRFAAHRLQGEWFTRCPEIEAEIALLNGGAA